ncbi:MAG: hypothetical protein WD766_08500 [Gemmatimonadota bacterium]
MKIVPTSPNGVSGARVELRSDVPVFEEDRCLAHRVRQKLLTYERHRDQLDPEARARVIEEIVQDTVDLAREYSLHLIREVRR